MMTTTCSRDEMVGKVIETSTGGWTVKVLVESVDDDGVTGHPLDSDTGEVSEYRMFYAWAKVQG